MTAKEYLSQAYLLDKKIDSKFEQLEILRSLTQRVTASYGGEVVSHTRKVTSLEDVIVRIAEMEHDLNGDIDRLLRLRQDISEIINQVRNESFRLILEKRHLCFQSWERIAEDLGCTPRWARTKYARALGVVEKLIPREKLQEVG